MIVRLLLLWLCNFSCALECFDCTNYPDSITCSTTASCTSKGGCYYATAKDSEKLKEVPYWVSSCIDDLQIQNYQTSCFSTAQEDIVCVCFNDFCNTPVEIENAIELRFSPFKRAPVLPWSSQATTSSQSTTTTPITVTFKDIRTTLVTRPTTTPSTTTTTAVVATITLPTVETTTEIPVGLSLAAIKATLQPTPSFLNEVKVNSTNSVAYLGVLQDEFVVNNDSTAPEQVEHLIPELFSTPLPDSEDAEEEDDSSSASTLSTKLLIYIVVVHFSVTRA